MGADSKIEWTHNTFNPWVGCQKVSAGCDNCYAEAWSKRSSLVQWGPHAARRRTSEKNWREPLKWARRAGQSKTRLRVFCASLADWLDNQVPQEWRSDLAELVEMTPELDWLLLTKRIENFRKLSPWTVAPPNVWLGITTENQDAFDRRWPLLAALDVNVRFISYEPALGSLTVRNASDVPGWIICGGESGHNARPMELSWACAVRDECADKDIPFFMKQIGGRRKPFPPIPNDLMIRNFPNAIPTR